MAESIAVLGALSSALQIVDFVAKFVVRAHKLIKADGDQLEELSHAELVAKEYDAIAKSVTETRRAMAAFEGLDEVDLRISTLAQKCQSEAQALLDAINNMRLSAAVTGWSRIKQGAQKAARHRKDMADIERRHKRLQELNVILSSAVRGAIEDREETVFELLLQDLGFSDMQFRKDSIADAYRNTCEWALHDHRYGLRPWLESGNGIFWITGKPGSGKSTLMKYLNMNPQTSDLLQVWCSGQHITIVNFYFWYLGSTMQRSIEGLLRSILHQLLVAIPELAREACPEYYAMGPFDESFRFKSKRQQMWTHAKLASTLQALITAAVGSVSGKRIFFLIDGLDEYNGDHLELIKILNGLTSYSGIKLCVASRPWTAFRNAFEHDCPNLRLEDLTELDIRTYVNGNVKEIFDSGTSVYENAAGSQKIALEDTASLINEVVRRAEGVFLWVYLVVAAIKRGFAEGDSLTMLLHRVKVSCCNFLCLNALSSQHFVLERFWPRSLPHCTDHDQAFPPDLEEFFQKLIFDRIDTVYVKQTCQALLLAHKYVLSPAAEASASFLDYWLIMQQPEGLPVDFALYPLPLAAQKLPRQTVNHMAQETKQLLSASCKDLLLIHTAEFYFCDDTVQFLHRTVFDFLNTDNMLAALSSNCPGFFMQDDRIFHLLNLAKIQLLGTFALESNPEYTGLAQWLMHFSLLSPHQDFTTAWTEQFAQAVETLPPFPDKDTIIVGSQVAVHEHRRLHEALLKFVGGPQDSTARRQIRFWIVAALGAHPAHAFTFQDVNLDILRELLNVEMPKLLFDPETPILGVDDCAVDLWQVFLRKWALARLKSKDNDDEIAQIDQSASRIVNVLGKFSPRPDRHFCDAPREKGIDHTHIHSWRRASTLLGGAKGSQGVIRRCTRSEHQDDNRSFGRAKHWRRQLHSPRYDQARSRNSYRYGPQYSQQSNHLWEPYKPPRSYWRSSEAEYW